MARTKHNSFWEKAASRAQDESVRELPAAGQPKKRPPLRRDPPAPSPPPPSPPAATDDELRLRLAEELDYARRILTLMGEELCNDPAIVVRHGSALQSVDIVGQMLGHIASVVRSSEPAASVERIGMAELKARLKRRGGV